MSEYKGIKGFQVQTRTEDPVPYAQALEDNPYAGAWSSGGDLNQGAYAVQAVGTLTAGLKTGGYIAPTAATSNDTEEYNGTSWSEQTNMPTGLRYGSGFGVQTSAVFSAGSSAPGGGTDYFDDALEYNGSSWTVGGTMNTKRRMPGGAGASETDGLLFGGSSGSPDASNQQTVNELYNGSAWTEVGDLNTARYNGLTSAGTVSTAAIAAGGSSSGSGVLNVEVYNGSSWTEVSDLNSTKASSTIGGMGTSTDAVVVSQATTESWDGSSWTEVAEVANSRDSAAAAGNQSNSRSGFLCAGNPAPLFAKTEEWTFSGLDPSTTPAADYADAITGDFYYNSSTGQFKTVNTGGAPIGTWASTNNLNTSRDGAGGAGLQTASLVFGGMLPPGTSVTAVTESYDGTSFTEVNDLNTARAYRVGGAGTQTAALAFGGGTAPGADKNETEVWNGSSWTEVNNLNNARESLGGAGFTNTAAIAAGGYDTALRAYTETWDGTNWTEVNDLNTAKAYGTLNGTSTDSIHAGGSAPGISGQVELWNGSSWTETTDLNTARSYLASSGTSTSIVVFGGYLGPPGNSAKTEFWNGSSWTEVNDMGTTRYGSAGTGQSSTSALAAGGYISDETNVAEEFTAADFQIKSVTTS